MSGITYTVHDTNSAIDGMTFTGGRVIDNHPQAGECVDFGSHTVNGKERHILVRLAGKPDLQALVASHRKAKQDAADADFRERYGKFIEEASRTGKPVVVETWVTDRCMNHNSDECSFDTATQVMLPSGKLKTTYRCCC